jgi:hypothetical protein
MSFVVAKQSNQYFWNWCGDDEIASQQRSDD